MHRIADPGQVYAQGAKGPMGRRIAADYQITVFEPNVRIEFQVIAGPARPMGGTTSRRSTGGRAVA